MSTLDVTITMHMWSILQSPSAHTHADPVHDVDDDDDGHDDRDELIIMIVMRGEQS